MKRWHINTTPTIIYSDKQNHDDKLIIEIIAGLFYNYICRITPIPEDVDLSKQTRGSK